MRIKEIKGQRFGELLVLDDFSKVLAKRSRRFLKCKCSCGNIAFIEKSKVLRGYTLSCGHLQREMRKNLDLILLKLLNIIKYNNLQGALYDCSA